MESSVLALEQVGFVDVLTKLIWQLAMLFLKSLQAFIKLSTQLVCVLLVLFQFLRVDLYVIRFLNNHRIFIRYLYFEHFLLVFKLVSFLHELQVVVSFHLNVFPEVFIYFLKIEVILLTDFLVLQVNFVEFIL